MKYLENENFDELINKGLYLVDFYAEWCGPCKMLGPVLEELENEIEIIKVNIDTHKDLTNKYKIMSVPTMIIFKDGNIIKEMIGYKDKEELLDIINNVK